jgi:hypothetical protein
VDLVAVLHGTVRVETFTYEVPGYQPVRWDILQAKAHVQAGHVLTRLTLSRETQQDIADRNTWDPAKLDQSDPTVPGIAAPLVYDGRTVMYVLIDGLHRNARALRDHRPFQAYLLTDAAARDCVLEGDPRLLPWTYAVEKEIVMTDAEIATARQLLREWDARSDKTHDEVALIALKMNMNLTRAAELVRLAREQAEREGR